MSNEYADLIDIVSLIKAEVEKMKRIMGIEAEPRQPDLCPYCNGELGLVEFGEHQCGNLAKVGREER